MLCVNLEEFLRTRNISNIKKFFLLFSSKTQKIDFIIMCSSWSHSMVGSVVNYVLGLVIQIHRYIMIYFKTNLWITHYKTTINYSKLNF